MKVVPLILLLSACTTVNLPPQQSQRQQQEQRQQQSQEQSSTQGQDQSTAHASDSRQGTVSQPIIVICNHVNSANSRCATPRDGEPVVKPFHLK